MRTADINKEHPSALQDINRSFLLHLFEYGPAQGRHNSSLGNLARMELFARLRDSLSQYTNGKGVPSIDVEKQDALQNLHMWINEEELFIDKRSTDADCNRYNKLKELLSWKRLFSRDTEWNDDQLTAIFCSLVNFSLLKVDALYEQMYYIDLYQSMQRAQVLEGIRRSVWVPFYQGNVGFAAQVGGLSLHNSLADPQGYVASNDLKQGSACTLYVGIGRQPIKAGQGRIFDPVPRWQFEYNKLAESNHLDPLKDTLRCGEECCAAVVFCSFPLANIFQKSEFPTRAKHGADGPNEVYGQWTASHDKNRIYELLEHVCHNYEHSLLRELDAYEEKSVSMLSAGALRKGLPKEERTLDVLASQNIRNNPTGGLLAIRSSISNPGLRVCIPQLENALTDKLDANADLHTLLEGTLNRWATTPADPLIDLLTRRIDTIEFGPVSGSHAGLSRPNKILLYAAANLDAESMQSLAESMKKIRDLLSEPGNALNNFFNLVRTRYFERLTEWYRKDTNEDLNFHQSKVARDACDNTARTLAMTICRGMPEDELDKKHLIENTFNLMKLATNHLTNRFDTYENGKDGISSDGVVAESIGEQSVEGNLTIGLLRDSLMALDSASRPLRPYLLGVSVHYWAELNIDPYVTETSAEPEQWPPFLADVLRWDTMGPDAQNRLRRPHVLAFMRGQNAIKNSHTTSVRLLDTDRFGKLKMRQQAGPFEWNSVAGFMIKFADRKEQDGTHTLGFEAESIGQPEVPEKWEYRWVLKPKYRLAGLVLNQDPLEKMIKSEIRDWTKESLRNDALLESLRTHLNAAEVDLAKAAASVAAAERGGDHDPGAYEDLGSDWDVVLYTIRGCWTKHSIRVASDMKRYEDYLRSLKLAEWQKLFNGVTHHVGNAMMPMGILADTLKDDATKQLLKSSVGSLQRWTQLVLALMDPTRFQRRRHMNVTASLSETAQRATVDGLLSYMSNLLFIYDCNRKEVRSWGVDPCKLEKLIPILANFDSPMEDRLQSCQELMPDTFNFSLSVTEDRVPYSDLFYGIVLEAVLNALKNTQQVTIAGAYLKISVSAVGDLKKITIVNTCTRDDERVYCAESPDRAGEMTGGIGVQFLDQITRSAKIGFTKRSVDTSNSHVRRIETEFSIPHDWTVPVEKGAFYSM